MEIVSKIHSQGHNFFSYPFKVYYLEKSSETEKVLRIISVPKRNFKRAVKRNKIRRRTKEAIRLNDSFDFFENYHILVVYIANKILDYDSIYKSISAFSEKIS